MKIKSNFSLVSAIALLVACGSKPAEVYLLEGKAANGYDVVAYFEESRPVAGSDEFATSWNDATWLFSSEQNLERFKREPDKFAPQYGGYCAFGTADGHKAPTQPDAWTIVGGKLYLNYNKEVKTEWLKDTTGYIRRANQNWPQVKLQDF